MIRALTSEPARIRRFVGAYAALVRRALIGHTPTLLLLIALSIASAFAFGAVAALIGIIINAMQSGDLHGLSGSQIPIVGGLVLLVLAALSALSAFAAAKVTRRIARSTQVRTLAALLTKLDTSTALSNPAMPTTRGELTRLLMRDSNHIANAVEVILRALEPAIRFVVFASILLYINPIATLIAVPFALILVPILRVLVSGVRRDSSEFFEARVVSMIRRLSTTIIDINAVPWRRTDTHPDWADEHLRTDPDIRDYLDYNDRIQLASARVNLGVNLAGSILLVVGVLIAASIAIHDNTSWGTALTFLVAFRSALAALQSGLSTMSSMGMFYPALQRTNAFLNETPLDPSTTPITDTPSSPLRFPLTLRASTTIDNSPEQAHLNPGDILALQTNTEPARTSLIALLTPLVTSSSQPALFASTDILAPRATLTNAPLSTRIPDPATRATIDAAAHELDITTPVPWNDTLTQAQWDTLDRKLRLLLIAGAGASLPGSVIAIDIAHLVSTSPRAVERAYELLAHKLVLITTRAKPLPICKPTLVALCDYQTVRALGDMDWARALPDTPSPTPPTSIAHDLDDLLDV